jgi:ribosomal protein L37AE/L43A
MTMLESMSSTDHGTTCAKCGETLFVPEWSEFVSERLIVNLWTCTTCGDRFETSACRSADDEAINVPALMEEFFPGLLVA